MRRLLLLLLGLILSLSVVSSSAALANDDFLIMNQRGGDPIGVLNKFPGVPHNYLWRGGQWTQLGAVIHQQGVVWTPTGSVYGVLRPDAMGIIKITYIDFASRRPVWVSAPPIPGANLNEETKLGIGRLADGRTTIDVLIPNAVTGISTWFTYTRQGGWNTVANFSAEATIDVHDGMACVADPGVDEIVVQCDYTNGDRLSGGALSTHVVPAPDIVTLSVFEVMSVQQWAVLNWQTATGDVGAAVDTTGTSFDAPTHVDVVTDGTVYYTDIVPIIDEFHGWTGPAGDFFILNWAGVGLGPTFTLGEDGRNVFGVNERAGALGTPFFVN